MNTKRFVGASIAVFAAFEVMDYLIHYVLLMPAYQQLSGLWRPDMQSKMWVMVLATLVTSFLFVYIFIKGYEDKGIWEGVRFGILLGLFMNVIGAFSQYVVYPIPLSLTLQWFVLAMLEFIAAGIIAALVYKKK